MLVSARTNALSEAGMSVIRRVVRSGVSYREVGCSMSVHVTSFCIISFAKGFP